MPGQTVTVRIETEASTDPASTDTTFMTDDPAFGIWRDRKEMTDVDLYVRALRAPRQS